MDLWSRGGTQVRAIVEPPFHVIRSLFGSRKVSYRGIAKNAVRAKAYAAPANLYLARRRLAAAGHVCVRNMTGGAAIALKRLVSDLRARFA